MESIILIEVNMSESVTEANILFTPEYYDHYTPVEEAACRFLCKIHDVDPNLEAVGLGHLMPKGYRYKMWQVHLYDVRMLVAGGFIKKSVPSRSRLLRVFNSRCGGSR